MSINKHLGDFNWHGIDTLVYKEDGTHFQNINRRVLYKGSDDLKAELRYFEIGQDGHSTLECHKHIHVVVIVRGHGNALVGGDVIDVAPFDVIEIAPLTWHQFRATKNEPLGFFCLVNSERDRPHLPDEHELNELKSNKQIADFIRI